MKRKPLVLNKSSVEDDRKRSDSKASNKKRSKSWDLKNVKSKVESVWKVPKKKKKVVPDTL